MGGGKRFTTPEIPVFRKNQASLPRTGLKAKRASGGEKKKKKKKKEPQTKKLFSCVGGKNKLHSIFRSDAWGSCSQWGRDKELKVAGD